MSEISRDGFWASITGSKGRVLASAKFMGSTVNVDASLELAKALVGYMPFLQMAAPKRKADFDDATKALKAAIQQAGG